MDPKTEKAKTRQPAQDQDNVAKDAPPAEMPAAESTPEDKIRVLEEEIAGLKDQRIRALAETDNIRKRSQRDQEEIAKFAIAAFARDMVGVLENLTRATESIAAHKEQTSEELLKTLGQGVDLTLRELLTIFEKFQIKRISPQGEKFDHNLHQAVAQVERDDVPPGTVVQIIEAGYTLHGRLLKPAMVAVSKQGGDAPKTVDTSA